MTSYANPAVYQCPACQGLFLRARLRSFNTFGVTYWSDGDATFSRLPSHSPLIRCPSCPAVFWEDDLSPIGELPKEPLPQKPMGWFMRKMFEWSEPEHGQIKIQRTWNAAPAEWRAAKYDDELDYSDLCMALTTINGQDSQRAIYVRRRIWWLTNDFYRVYSTGKHAPIPPLAARTKATENMLQLAELHEQAASGLVDRAEIFRQLGRFNESITLLETASKERIAGRGEKILSWALAGDSGLKLIGQDPY